MIFVIFRLVFCSGFRKNIQLFQIQMISIPDGKPELIVIEFPEYSILLSPIEGLQANFAHLYHGN